MNTIVKTAAKKPAKPAAKAASGKLVRSSSGSTVLTGQALIDDMRAFRREMAADPDLALELLMKMGVMTKTGKLKTLIRA